MPGPERTSLHAWPKSKGTHIGLESQACSPLSFFLTKVGK